MNEYIFKGLQIFFKQTPELHPNFEICFVSIKFS